MGLQSLEQVPLANRSHYFETSVVTRLIAGGLLILAWLVTACSMVQKGHFLVGQGCLVC